MYFQLTNSVLGRESNKRRSGIRGTSYHAASLGVERQLYRTTTSEHREPEAAALALVA